MIAIRSLAVAAAFLLAGCHYLLPGGTRCPAHGGPQWREYRSAHFLVDTDLDRAAAEALVRDLERIQVLVTVALTGAPREIPGYVRVVVPARHDTFQSVAPRESFYDFSVTLGYYTIGRFGEPLMVLEPDSLRRDPEVIAHELAHHLSWYCFPRQPRWFSEGLAQFVQTVATETPQYRNAAGLVPRVRWNVADSAPLTTLEILTWRGGGNEGRYGLWSWVLYHWLWDQRPKQLAEFQRRLGLGEDPGSAWKQAFPDIDPSDAKALRKIDAALDEHRRSGELVYYEVKAQVDSWFTDQPLPPADVHVLLADSRGSVNPAEVSAALDDDPRHPVALALRARLDRVPAAPLLRTATVAHPGDWRAWLLLAGALDPATDAAEIEAALRKALELNPSSASAQGGLGWLLARAHRAEEALPFARRAVEIAPASGLALETMATVAVELGACEEALSFQHRAVDLAPADERSAFARRLHGMEKRCSTRPAAAAPPQGR